MSDGNTATEAQPGQDALAPTPEWPTLSVYSPNAAILLISFATLFLQVMLIRWIGTEVRIFAYLQNTILVVCFLGLGLGCFYCRVSIRASSFFVPLVLLGLLLAVPASRALLNEVPDYLGPLARALAWVGYDVTNYALAVGKILIGLGVVLVLMALMCLPFFPLGQIMGRLMDDHPRVLVAYSINIVGSLLGVWSFALLSWFYLPPTVWTSVAMASVLPFFWTSLRASVVSTGLALAFVLASFSASRDSLATEVVKTYWSPYQKLALSLETRGRGAQSVEIPWVRVNNVGYQAIFYASPEVTTPRPSLFDPAQTGYTQYDIPLLLHHKPRRALIAGAGSGNDAAGCLRQGVEEVVAIEIDPAIIALGKEYHAERPYDSPKVRVVNNDARAFFATSQEKFDVVIFGLLDSHTTTSLANARLDHYVYTRESLAQAHRLLADDGLLVMTFAPGHGYVLDRIARMLREEFGAEPYFFEIPNNLYGFGGVMFVAGNLPMAQARLAAQPQLQKLIDQWRATNPWHGSGRTTAGSEVWRVSYSTQLTHDDWPYIYLEKPSLPVLFFLLAGLVYLMLSVVRRILQLPPMPIHWNRDQFHFAFLGAAFLLLEVQNISKASVALGNTWVVSAVIISGVLVMVLAANLVAACWPKLPIGAVGGVLLATCLGLYFLDLSVFAYYPFPLKALLVGTISTLPMLFSGIIFIRSFAAAPRKDAALGANLMGSLVGGLLQSLTFLTGTRALLLLVAVFYTCAIFTRPRPAPALAD